ncbi:MAG: hypothetical protein RQM92_07825 [Candidatus Syntrophopropionicum ammoniitolerans]
MKGEKEKTTGLDDVVIATTFYPIYIEAANVTKNIPGIKLINLHLLQQVAFITTS